MIKFAPLVAVGFLLVVSENVSAVTIQFDFNGADSATVNPVTPFAQSVANAVDTSGVATSVNLTLNTTESPGFNEATGNASGTDSPGAPASEFFSAALTQDSLFGHADAGFSQRPAREKVDYDITGLEPNTAYDFTFFASRLGVGAGEVRDATYTVNGSSVTLDAANNVSEIAELLGVMSNGLGEATLTIAEGPNNTNSRGFFYLGAMQISNVPVPEPGSGVLLAIGLASCMAGLWRGQNRRQQK